MPIPEPTPSESKESYIKRCMAFEVKEGVPQDQAYAICVAKWEDSTNGNAG